MSQYSNHLFEPGSKNNSWSHLYEYINEGDNVLDVGCSSGNFGEVLIKLKNCTVTGLDLDKEDINKASKKLNKAIVGDINDELTRKKLGKYDIIIFADVIEHLPEPRETLKNIKSLLKNNGRIIFSIPHMAHISVRIDLLAGKFPYKNRGLLDKTHFHFYDQNELGSVFADAGYKIHHYNPVISKYPKQLMKAKLQKYGLSFNGRFIDNLQNTGGDIFQFIGSAMPSKNSSKSTLPEYKMPQDEIYEFAQKVIAENKKLHNQITVFQKEKELEEARIIRRINNKLNKIINTLNKQQKK